MKKLPLLFTSGLLIILVGSYFLIPSFQAFVKEAFEVLSSKDQELIQSWVKKFGIAGPAVLLLMMVVQMFLLVVPNIFLMMVAIISFGPVWGGIVAFLGIFLSSTLGFIIGRYLGPVTVNKLIGKTTQDKIGNFISNYGIAFITITRLSSLSNDSLSIVAGVVKMKYTKYIIATMTGITPLIIILAIYGKNGRILNALPWIAGVSMLILIVYIYIDKRKKKKAEQQNNTGFNNPSG